MKKLLLATAAAGVVGFGMATPASAALTLGVELSEPGYASVYQTSTSTADVFVGSYGTYSENIDANTVSTDPLSIDLNSTTVSTTTGGTLTITVSVSGLTSPIGVEEFISQVTGHLVTGSGTVTMSAYIDDNDELYATTTPLASSLTVGDSGSDFATTTSPFSLTEVFTVSATGPADFSFDGSTVLPEPISLTLLGSGLVGLGMVRRRRA